MSLVSVFDFFTKSVFSFFADVRPFIVLVVTMIGIAINNNIRGKTINKPSIFSPFKCQRV